MERDGAAGRSSELALVDAAVHPAERGQYAAVRPRDGTERAVQGTAHEVVLRGPAAQPSAAVQLRCQSV